jgi:hypothetical protein
MYPKWGAMLDPLTVSTELEDDYWRNNDEPILAAD